MPVHNHDLDPTCPETRDAVTGALVGACIVATLRAPAGGVNPESVDRHDPTVNFTLRGMVERDPDLERLARSFSVALPVNDPARPAGSSASSPSSSDGTDPASPTPYRGAPHWVGGATSDLLRYRDGAGDEALFTLVRTNTPNGEETVLSVSAGRGQAVYLHLRDVPRLIAFLGGIVTRRRR